MRNKRASHAFYGRRGEGLWEYTDRELRTKQKGIL